jgi:hypothetical protein
MPGSITRNNFLKVLLTVLLYFSEYLQVIQTETLSRRFVVLGTKESHGAK